MLHALHWKTAVNLRRWMRICPRRQITVLDTHDGAAIKYLNYAALSAHKSKGIGCPLRDSMRHVGFAYICHRVNIHLDCQLPAVVGDYGTASILSQSASDCLAADANNLSLLISSQDSFLPKNISPICRHGH